MFIENIYFVFFVNKYTNFSRKDREVYSTKQEICVERGLEQSNLFDIFLNITTVHNKILRIQYRRFINIFN